VSRTWAWVAIVVTSLAVGASAGPCVAPTFSSAVFASGRVQQPQVPRLCTNVEAVAFGVSAVLVQDRPPAGAQAPMPPEAGAVLARAIDYATGYEAEVSALVADEKYEQRASLLVRTTLPTRTIGSETTSFGTDWRLDIQRLLKSDYLLVQAPGVTGWLPFRDVYEVDGKKVRDRDARLQKLFLDAPATAVQRATEILAESARYNIGFVERNLNVPTLALRFLDKADRGRAVFRKVGETTIEGVHTWEYAYEERQSPTLVSAAGDSDNPAEGSFWIDPGTGRVMKSTLRLIQPGVTIEITVTYRPDAKAARAWLPSEMRETYVGAAQKLECVAKYTNIRRFQVTTDTKIAK
jgi:hypothetical protein